MQNVYFFEKPTIGYCKECDCVAEYRDEMRCPECKDTENLSFFVWDETSEYPE